MSSPSPERQRAGRPLVDFIIVGAGRCGTTALHHTLGRHPEVYVSRVKETNFFSLEDADKVDGATLGFPLPDDEVWIRRRTAASVISRPAFEALFENAPRDSLRGEASPVYLYSPRAPVLMHDYVPDVKLIAVLRQPVERAYSSFALLNRSQIASLPASEIHSRFERLLADEAQTIEMKRGGMLHELRQGFYTTHLARYFRRFSSDQIRIYLYDRLVADSAGLVRDILAFIGADPEAAPDLATVYNASGVPRSSGWHTWLARGGGLKRMLKSKLPAPMVHRLATLQNRLKNANLTGFPRMTPDFRARLTELYYDDEITKLEGMLGVDLTAWR